MQHLAGVVLALTFVTTPSIPAADGSPLRQSVRAVAPATGSGEPADDLRAIAPDLRIVSWSVDDTAVGNGDLGAHPGETVVLTIEVASLAGAARFVTGTLDERVDHPDIEILDKTAQWPDIPALGTAASIANHFTIRIADTRPCEWIVPLRLTIRADEGYEVTRDLDLPLTNPRQDSTSTGRYQLFGTDGENSGVGTAFAIGDFDGDRIRDLAIGAPLARSLTGSSNAGQVTVLYGPLGAGDQGLYDGANLRVYGIDSLDELGSSLAFGDFNGDGTDDLMVGVPGSDGPSNSNSNEGEVRVFWGNTTRRTGIQDLAVDTSSTTYIRGASDGERWGSAVATGNVNGDGLEDLLIGAPPGRRAALLLGQTSLPSTLALGFSNVSFYDEPSSLARGRTVALGDVNGDGLDDLLIGNAEADPAFADVIIVNGADAIGSRELTIGAPGIAGLNSAEAALASVVAGDVNGDGYEDVIGGFPFARGADGATEGGRVIVAYGSADGFQGQTFLEGAPQDRVSTFLGAAPGDELGGTVLIPTPTNAVGTGDIDGDGIDDVVAAALQTGAAIDGIAYVVHGRPGRLPDLDLSTPSPEVRVITEGQAGLLGFGTVIGDLNDDGLGEVVLGSPNRSLDGGSTFPGTVTVFRGEQRLKLRHDPDTFSFIDATGGTEIPLSCDDCGAAIPIGFDFVFDGRTFDQVTVSSNGYLTFGGDGSAPFGFCPGNTASPNGVIAPFWDDLNLESRGAVYSLVEGTAPNRRLTVAWVDVPVFPDTGEATFEVTLFESSNRIVMQYQDTFFEAAHPSNDGANATVNVEGVTGKYDAAFSCFTNTVTSGTAVAYRFFANPAAVYGEGFEDGDGGWTTTGLWHRISEPTCSPSARNGSSSFYFGQDATCNFDTGAAEVGVLLSPEITLPQDPALDFWSRRQAETGGFDVTEIQYTTNGTGFSALGRVDDFSSEWVFSDDDFVYNSATTRFDLIGINEAPGTDVQLRFVFNTIDEFGNTGLGWMVDDVTIRGCPVFDAGAGAPAGAGSEARATAQADAICEDESGLLDAVGSFCSACSSLTYQWNVDGAPIGGATSPTYEIPSGETPDTYAYSVEIGCATAAVCAATSPNVAVEVVQKPIDVGDGLRAAKTDGNTKVRWTWSDAAGADDYVLNADVTPVDRIGGFAGLVGLASTGTTGVETALTPTTEYYLVSGRNPTCGVGPR